MERARKKPQKREVGEVRFAAEEWVSAVLSVVLILVGAALTLALAYRFVLPHGG